MLTLANFFTPGRGWAQNLSVPLGQAAQFGLLSGATLDADSSAELSVLGAAGAAGATRGLIQTTGNSSSADVAAALADLATARAWCAAQPATSLTWPAASGHLAPGIWRTTGSATLAPDSYSVGAEYVTIGNFSPTYKMGPDQNFFDVGSADGDCQRSYYLIDNVFVIRLPDPQDDYVCGLPNFPVTIGNPPYGNSSGVPVSYQWRRLRGPGQMVDSTVAQTIVIGAADTRVVGLAGASQFQLTVTINGSSYTYPAIRILNHYGGSLTVGQASACTGDSVLLTYATDAPTYELVALPAGGAPQVLASSGAVPAGATLWVHPTVPTIYELRLPSGGPCAADTLRDSIDVWVPYRTFGLTVTPVGQRCLGENVTVRVTPPIPAGAWHLEAADLYGTRSLGAPTAPYVDQPRAAVTQYRVVDDGHAPTCPAAVATVRLSPAPSVGIYTPVLTVCGGTRVLLQAISSAASYEWDTGQWGDTISVVLPASVPGGRVTFSVTAYAAGTYCQGGASITLTVLPAPVVTGGGPYAVYTDQLVALPTAGPAPAGGTWSDPSNQLQIDAGRYLINPAPGSYQLLYTVTNPNGCEGRAWVEVTVYDAPLCASRRGVDVVVELGNPGALDPDPAHTSVVGDTIVLDMNGNGYQFQPLTYLLTCSVKLRAGTFTVPPGCKLLFEEKTRLTVSDKARLEVRGATLTAACGELWDALYVDAPDAALCLGGPGDGFYSPLPTPQAPPTDPSKVSELSHSRYGVVWRYPGQSLCRLVNTRFINNRFSSLWTSEPGGLTNGQPKRVRAGSAVVNCAFESDPAKFKLDPRETTCCLGGTTQSYAMLNLGGWSFGDNLIAGNAFGAALVSVYSVTSAGETGDLTLGPQNTFSGFGLAGVRVGRLRGPLSVVGNTFEFPAPGAWPAAALLARFQQTYPGVAAGGGLAGTVGVAVGEVVADAWLGVEGNRFVQELPIANHNTAPVHPQRGVVVAALRGPYSLARNGFWHLRAGLALGLYYRGAESEVGGNSFVSCTVNMSLFNQGVSASNAPVFWPRCNSFARGGTAAGNTYGIRLEPGTRVRLDRPGALPFTEPMKNFFSGQAPNRWDRFWWIDNLSGLGQVEYFTYEQNLQPAPVNINLWAEVDANSRNVVSPGNRPRPNFVVTDSCGAADGYPGTGINPPRSGPGGGAVLGGTDQGATETLTLAPNPAEASAMVKYHLATGTTTAVLHLTDALGRVVHRQSLVLDVNSATLSVADLPAGVYSCVLTANGVRLRACKLLIQH